MSLADKTLLTQLTIRHWIGRKTDRQRSVEVADAHGVNPRVGRYNKDLLPNTPLLGHIHAKTNSIRTLVAANTLPWGVEGTRILPTSNFLSFSSKYNKERDDWQQLTDKFIREYPTLVVNAEHSLRDLYDARDYPDSAHIASKFEIKLAFLPVPTTDFRVSMAESDLEELRSSVEQRISDATRSAQLDLWQRMFDRVEEVQAKLADPSAIFRDSLIDNTMDLCNLIGKLNFAEDPAIEEMRNTVKSKLARLNPDVLRVDPDIRRATANEASAIMDRMKAYMGGE